MKFYSNERIFDTLIDTKKMYVSITTRFSPRADLKKDGLSHVYLSISKEKVRIRIPLHIHVPLKKWDKNNQRLKSNDVTSKDLNLLLDNIEAKITKIKTEYRLAESELTPELLVKEYHGNMPRINFIAFLKLAIKDERPLLARGTYKRHLAVLRKLEAFKPEIPFSDIDLDFFDDFRRYFRAKQNSETTIRSNITVLKKYLKIAKKQGVKLKIDLEDVKVGPTYGNRISLSPEDTIKCFNYFTSMHITEERKLVLGYFLFSCYTGLRFTDVMNLSPANVAGQHLQFLASKTGKTQTIKLIESAKVVCESPGIFLKKLTNQYINRELKNIMTSLGIRTKVSFHTARHTFATNFLIATGKVESLQILLGHSDIKETMIYAHITSKHANQDIDFMEQLLSQ